MRQVSATRFLVEREWVESYVRHPERALELGRVAWQRDETGEVVGFRIARVRCASPLRALGLRRGDVIVSIGGRRVDSYRDAVRVLRRFHRRDHLRVRVLRGGRRLVLAYRLV